MRENVSCPCCGAMLDATADFSWGGINLEPAEETDPEDYGVLPDDPTA